MILRSQHDIFIFISMYLKLKTISDVLVAANRGITALQSILIMLSLTRIYRSPHPHRSVAEERRLTWVAHKIHFMVICEL